MDFDFSIRRTLKSYLRLKLNSRKLNWLQFVLSNMYRWEWCHFAELKDFALRMSQNRKVKTFFSWHKISRIAKYGSIMRVNIIVIISCLQSETSSILTLKLCQERAKNVDRIRSIKINQYAWFVSRRNKSKRKINLENDSSGLFFQLVWKYFEIVSLRILRDVMFDVVERSWT